MVAEVFEEHKPDERFTEETMEKISVLVVDDDPKMRDSLIRIFKKEGYDAHGAEDGIDAMAHLEQMDYQVAVVDDKMPHMDGLKLLEQIAQGHPNTKVIVMSAYATVERAVRAMRLGAFDYIITKPFSHKELMLRVRRAARPRPAVQEEQKSCPKCNRKMQSDWRYCPYDGTSID